MRSEKPDSGLEELAYWHWLAQVPGLGPCRFKTLLTLFGGDLSKVAELRAEQLTCIRGIDDKIAKAIEESRSKLKFFGQQVAAQRKRAEQTSARLLKLTDPDYPRLLRCSTVSPPILYVKGTIGRFNTVCGSVAIVGSRGTSEPSLRAASAIAGAFAARGWAVVSGLAKGADMAAHQGALGAGGLTVGVLGCGVDVLYPPESASIRAEMERSGAVVSEYPFQARPNELNLKKRNKLTVALAQAVVVIETGLKGGTMNAVRAAQEQRKPVFALTPGPGDGFEANRELIGKGAATEVTPESAFDLVAARAAPWPAPESC